MEENQRLLKEIGFRPREVDEIWMQIREQGGNDKVNENTEEDDKLFTYAIRRAEEYIGSKEKGIML